MLILILISIEYLQDVVFSIEKSLRHFFLDKVKVTDEELITKSPDFLLASIEAAMTDPFHNMKVS